MQVLNYYSVKECNILKIISEIFNQEHSNPTTRVNFARSHQVHLSM